MCHIPEPWSYKITECGLSDASVETVMILNEEKTLLILMHFAIFEHKRMKSLGHKMMKQIQDNVRSTL